MEFWIKKNKFLGNLSQRRKEVIFWKSKRGKIISFHETVFSPFITRYDFEGQVQPEQTYGKKA